MKNDEKVVYLTDYIKTEENIITLTPKEKTEYSIEPKSFLTKRVFAFGIDLATILLIKTSLHTAYALFINQFFSPLSSYQRASMIQGNISLHVLSFLAIYTSYFLYTAYILEGKTLGKMTLGLRVVSESFIQNHSQQDFHISLKDSIRRSIGYLLCYLSFGTFFIFNFSSEDKRGLPDYLSSSRTVSDDWLNKTLEKRNYEAEIITIDIHSLELSKSA